MLLAIDIGNTSISVGLFAPAASPDARPDLCLKAKMATDRRRSVDEYAVILSSLMRGRDCDPAVVTSIIIGSVVPPLTHTLQSTAELMINAARKKESNTSPAPVTATVVGSGVRTGISLLVDDPGQLGADIVSNAAAATWLYGAPVILVDLGTATVISAVGSTRSLLGVSITPGVSVAMEGLRASAAQIPYVELKEPGPVLGKNTAVATRSGVVYGTACLVDGMLDRIMEETHLPPDTPVVATGGLCDLVVPYCRHTLTVEPDLTLLGLYRIARLTGERQAKKGRKPAPAPQNG